MSNTDKLRNIERDIAIEQQILTQLKHREQKALNELVALHIDINSRIDEIASLKGAREMLKGLVGNE